MPKIPSKVDPHPPSPTGLVRSFFVYKKTAVVHSKTINLKTNQNATLKIEI